MTEVRVGPIVLEDADGIAIATAVYQQHPHLREPVIQFEGVGYAQNRVDSSGRWVYRAQEMGPRSSQLTDPLLTAITRLEPPAAVEAVCAACGRAF